MHRACAGARSPRATGTGSCSNSITPMRRSSPFVTGADDRSRAPLASAAGRSTLRGPQSAAEPRDPASPGGRRRPAAGASTTKRRRRSACVLGAGAPERRRARVVDADFRHCPRRLANATRSSRSRGRCFGGHAAPAPRRSAPRSASTGSASASRRMHPQAPPVLGRDIARRARERVRRAARSQRLRQDDAAQHHRRPRARLSGKVRVDDAPVTGPGGGKGMVFQQSALFPWLTASANVEFAAKRRGIGDAGARDAGARAARRWSASRVRKTSIRSSSPAACSNASRSRARSRSTRRSC